MENQQKIIQHTLASQLGPKGQQASGEAAGVDPSLALIAGAGLSDTAGPPAGSSQSNQDDQYFEDNYLAGSHENPAGNDEYIPEYVNGSHPENLEDQEMYIPGPVQNPNKSQDRDMQELNMDFEDCMNNIEEVEKNAK